MKGDELIVKIDELVEEIKVDLGSDINSLGISDDSISLKIHEALRKISVYAPLVCTEVFALSGSQNSAQLPEDATTVFEVLNLDKPAATKARVAMDDTDLFSVSRYLYNYNDLSDPYIFLMQKNAVSTLQNFVRLTDFRFEKSNHTLYLSNAHVKNVCVKYLRKYRSVEEIEDIDVQQIVKEYALALCKIIEGNIRRKLQSAPGAIQLDGDSLVSEGMSEKRDIEAKLPNMFQNLRFGIRA